jgi:hypothetical protein
MRDDIDYTQARRKALRYVPRLHARRDLTAESSSEFPGHQQSPRLGIGGCFFRTFSRSDS